MKKIVIFISIIFIMILSLGSTGYSLEDNTDSIETNVYINDMRVPTVKVRTHHYIKVNDLKKLGFDVSLDEKNKEISINQNPNLIMQPVEIKDYKEETSSLSNTEFKININENSVEAKSIKEDVVIDVESFLKIKGFNFEKKMDDRDNSCDIHITNSDGFVNSFTKPDKTKIHITKKGNDLYNKNYKIGLIKDNIEWISLDYIKKLIEFDEVKEKRYEDGIWIYLRKENYDVEIQVNKYADAECGNYFMDLTARPIEIDNEFYIPLVDAIQLFNLDIISDNAPNKIESSNNIGFGNGINGINVIRNNEWFYYIKTNYPKNLYRIKKDMSEKTKISNDDVEQFYIDKDKIYYIGCDNETDKKGLYKMNLNGTNKQPILEGNISFLSILNDDLYYCDGLDGGNLYKIDKNGKNKKMIISGKAIYPNITNEWIYYINGLDNNSIYRCKLDGSYNVKINSADTKCLNVDNEKIYYSDSSNIYFMNHDGSFRNKIFNRWAKNIIISKENIFWIYKKSIYKKSKNSVLNELICESNDVIGIGLEDDELNILEEKWLRSSIKFDINNEKKEILDIKDCYRIEEIRYPYIYYRGNNAELMKYNIDTKVSETIISKDFSSIFNIIDDWIYYHNWGDGGLYRVKTDGSNNMKLLDRDIYDVNVDSSGIYYLVSKQGMTIEDYCKVNLDGTNKQVLINDLNGDYAFRSIVKKDYIYYIQKDGLYSVKKDGTEKKKVIDKQIHDVSIT